MQQETCGQHPRVHPDFGIGSLLHHLENCGYSYELHATGITV